MCVKMLRDHACKQHNRIPPRLRLSKVVVVGDLYVGKTSLIHRCACWPHLPALVVTPSPGRPSSHCPGQNCVAAGNHTSEGYKALGSSRSGGGVQRPRTLTFMSPSPRTMGSHLTGSDLQHCLPGCYSPSSPTQFLSAAPSVCYLSSGTIMSLYSLWVDFLLPADVDCREQSLHTQPL